jgi:hypothetical protein
MGQIVPELGGEMGPYCVVYDTRLNFETGKTPILFSKKIGKMKDVLAARSVDVGAIKHDRQGIRYFQIHDPERNVIEGKRASNPPSQAAEPVVKCGYGSSDERSHGKTTDTGRDSADCVGVCN